MIVCRSSMLSRFINDVLRRRPGMLGLDHLIAGTLSGESGRRPMVHFQTAIAGTFWVATGVDIATDSKKKIAVLRIDNSNDTVFASFRIGRFFCGKFGIYNRGQLFQRPGRECFSVAFSICDSY
jgi:hypothetical protein